MLFELPLCLPLKGVLNIGGRQAEFYFILKGTVIIIYNYVIDKKNILTIAFTLVFLK